MSLELTLKSGTFLELATGKVIKGKEMQVFGEYFPAITPALSEYGIQPLRSFAVLATNTRGIAAEMGSLTQYPQTENYTRFINDARFLKAKPLRDDGLEFLADGNFFTSLDKTITLRTDANYALIIAKGNPLNSEPLLELPTVEDGTTQIYSGKSITLHPWNDNAALILNTSPDEALIFKIRFNPSDA
ncbi:hypothetical protein A9Q99_05020 [Gammaproteobacteria bacterium 45_16_T64]|mgnify:CR=1 FL=1|nr:hypothetical protein A9Q99_05020 [Gammaproteobacteria bacterium 45_16_T64]